MVDATSVTAFAKDQIELMISHLDTNITSERRLSENLRASKKIMDKEEKDEKE